MRAPIYIRYQDGRPRLPVYVISTPELRYVMDGNTHVQLGMVALLILIGLGTAVIFAL